MPESSLFIPRKFAGGDPDEHPFDGHISELVTQLLERHDSLILIMATGIAVRAVAPLLKHKHEDPGVLVIDEQGKHVISLIGGHSRRSNALASRIASLIEAEPVITTASDVSGIPAIDLIGQEFGWKLEGGANAARVAAAVLNGDPVGIYQDSGETDWAKDVFPPNVFFAEGPDALKRPECRGAILITHRRFGPEDRGLLQKAIVYRPRSLVVGLGFNRGATAQEIGRVVARVFVEWKLCRTCIRKLATIDLKADDPALAAFAQELGVPVECFSADSLRAAEFPSSPSEAVFRAVDLPAVCEPAALLCSGASSLIVPKVKRGNVTVAVAEAVLVRRGKLSIVGTGPGSPAQLTRRASEAIRECDVILGYKTYVKSLGNLTDGKRVIESGMRQELERTREAMDLAASGKRVALVSGGDPGVYGMSAPVFEILSEGSPAEFDIEVFPGVPALTAAAALLGAPLSQDFASISLSDLLTPWETIADRLDKAAQADFVIVLYNPRSRGRRHQFGEALNLIRRHRSGSTVVGIVRGAYRHDQQVHVTVLDNVRREEIDMSTVVIIGNSSTRSWGRWMVTPRGYRARYG